MGHARSTPDGRLGQRRRAWRWSRCWSPAPPPSPLHMGRVALVVQAANVQIPAQLLQACVSHAHIHSCRGDGPCHGEGHVASRLATESLRRVRLIDDVRTVRAVRLKPVRRAETAIDRTHRQTLAAIRRTLEVGDQHCQQVKLANAS